MIALVIPVVFLWATCKAEDYYYSPLNGTRATLSGIAAYRSALTLDWLAAEDLRQRELASAFETEPSPPSRSISTDCIGYSRPASGKVARLMLELLKNLEGDDGTIVSDLITALVRTKLLVETSMLDAEPDLDSLVKTPAVMMGEPHTTFPRILAMSWMAVTDPVTTKKFGWCPINRINRYLTVSRPIMIAKQMRALEPVIARARFIMEEFIQHVTPLNMYQRKLENNGVTPLPKTHEDIVPMEADPGFGGLRREGITVDWRTIEGIVKEKEAKGGSHKSPNAFQEKTTTTLTERTEVRTRATRPTRTPNTARQVHMALAQANTVPSLLPLEPDSISNFQPEDTSTDAATSLDNLPHLLIATIVMFFDQ